MTSAEKSYRHDPIAQPLDDDPPLDSFTRPISPSRAALARATRDLDAANDALERANGPITRLTQLITGCDQAELALDGLRQRHLTALGEWLASGGVPAYRPQEPPELLRAEQALAGLQREAAAARSVIADHSAVAERAAEHVRECAARRDAALRQALIDAVREHLPQLAAAYEHAQDAEAKVSDLETHLVQTGDSATAATVREMVLATRQQIAQRLPAVNPTRGRYFIAQLLADVEAAL